ncbi:pyridoxal phosphate-dependent aminotransferase [Clostridium arbusti]|uniref:pyridoxal phosphate-dependent aminotransferase n=1 Tax=Clostridium arbusti TaxID=1137848 RepID=UPI000289CE68|nr:aminotransferase class I/II-fold pyridoxal phosphate-dependent enzyme [Clostridium arbusti]
MEKSKISSNVDSIEISGIRKFYNKVVKVEGAISLTLGQPDFPVPEGIKKAMIEAINENKTVYTSNAGILELRQEISNMLKTQDIGYDSDEICVTVGGSEGLMDVFSTLINPKDKVLIPTPAYPAYESCVKLLGGEIINYNLNESDFSIDFSKLQNIIKQQNPKLLVLSYPSNPTGAILSKEARDKLYEIVKNEDIIVITDEMYSSLCFEDNYYSIAQFKDIKDKVIVVNGFSKMFSMTGLRIGYVCASNKYIDSIIKVHQYNVSCAPSIAQYGVVHGLRHCMKDVEYMKGEFIKRRDYVYERLIKIGFEVQLPKGAFYIFPSIKKFASNSEEFCESILRKAKVAAVPGTAFGKGGEGYMRISYAYSQKQLEEAFDRIERVLL